VSDRDVLKQRLSQGSNLGKGATPHVQIWVDIIHNNVVDAVPFPCQRSAA
jgi:hypothetical protein